MISEIDKNTNSKNTNSKNTNSKNTNSKKSKTKRVKQIPVYRTKEERKEEVRKLVTQLQNLQLSREYDAIKIFYDLMFKYINEGERIIINIPFPEMKKRIEGVLAINKREEVSIRLKYEKF